MRHLGRSGRHRKVHFITEMRKRLGRLEFARRRIWKCNNRTVFPNAADTFNSLAQAEHTGVSIAERQRLRSRRQPRFNSDPGWLSGSDTYSSAECLCAGAREADDDE